MAGKAKAYRVVYEWGDDGVWTVTAPDVRGAHSQGKSIAQARERIREALGLFVDDADDAELKESFKLPAQVRRQVQQFLTAKARAAEQQKKAAKAARASVAALKREMSLTVRDAGAVLGISHQRVQQLIAAE